MRGRNPARDSQVDGAPKAPSAPPSFATVGLASLPFGHRSHASENPGVWGRAPAFTHRFCGRAPFFIPWLAILQRSLFPELLNWPSWSAKYHHLRDACKRVAREDRVRVFFTRLPWVVCLSAVVLPVLIRGELLKFWMFLIPGWCLMVYFSYVSEYFTCRRAIAFYLRADLANDGKLVCKECGYDLSGNVSGRCPECGSRIVV
jgi:hypothetical protein